MAYPVITVEIAFSSDPLATVPLYEDMTRYVRSIPLIRRGRQNALTTIEAGEAVVVLDNRLRTFDPTYAGSGPFLIPMRKIRISATYAATTYYLFTGYVESWSPTWEASNKNSEVTIHCVDAFKFFNQTTLSTSLPAENVKFALNTLMDTLSWPSSDRAILDGQTFVKALTGTNKNALQHIQDLMLAENGLFFMDTQGRTAFQGRQYRLTNSTSTTAQATFGDGGGSELPYQSLEPAYDDTQIYNDIHVTADAGTEQISLDPTSINNYFKRSLVRTGLLYGDASSSGGNTPENEAAGMAQWLLFNLKQPGLRFDSMTLEGGYSDNLWPQMLAREISDRITVKRRPPPSGSTIINKDVWIEAVEHRITDITASYLRWQTTWQLSEANTAAWWILDSTTYSVLDSTTIPAF